MEKAWFITPSEYNSNIKDIMTLMEYTLMVYIPNEKGIVS